MKHWLVLATGWHAVARSALGSVALCLQCDFGPWGSTTAVRISLSLDYADLTGLLYAQGYAAKDIAPDN